MKTLLLKLKSITHSGSHIGRDITVKIRCDNPKIKIEIKKDVLPDKITIIDQEVFKAETGYQDLELPLGITIIERDALFDDVGTIFQRLHIDTEKETSKHTATVKIYENRLFFWRKPAVFVLTFQAHVARVADGGILTLPVKKYTDTGTLGNEDYNRYDDIIEETVRYWNEQFAHDTEPPPELLDPNLVKAILYQETRIGYGEDVYDKNAAIDIMQVAYGRDPAIHALRAEVLKSNLEYWVHGGENIILQYPDAKVESPRDSVFWGVRWLYHKAHRNIQDDEGIWHNEWRTWHEAVRKYGPSTEYQENVWSMYKEGINKRDGGIKLWSFSGFLLLALLPFFVFAVGYNPEISDEMIKREFADSFPQRQARYRDDITIHRYQKDPTLFIAYEDDGEDWSESFAVGEAKGRNIEWYDIISTSDEKDPIFGVVSARFIDLKGFNYPVLEIWQISHRGHGFLDLYLVNDKELVQLARILAIDNHLEQYQPEGSSFDVGREYVSCGNVYGGEKHALAARYDDQNDDGIDDVILAGRRVEKCDKIIGHNEKGQIILQTDVVGDEPIETVHYLTDLPTLP